jgi:hypothetical protein
LAVPVEQPSAAASMAIAVNRLIVVLTIVSPKDHGALVTMVPHRRGWPELRLNGGQPKVRLN